MGPPRRGALPLECPSKLVTMSDPPPAFKGDLTWDTATIISFWTVDPYVLNGPSVPLLY
jgi:hypothetical protein